jgi:hypothetical protein
MDVLDQSAVLMRRGAELRGRSMRIRAAAAETVENCRQLIAAAARAQAAGMRAHGAERAGQRGRAPADELPPGR